MSVFGFSLCEWKEAPCGIFQKGLEKPTGTQPFFTGSAVV